MSAKFKQNIPRSSTTSFISQFSEQSDHVNELQFDNIEGITKANSIVDEDENFEENFGFEPLKQQQQLKQPQQQHQIHLTPSSKVGKYFKDSLSQDQYNQINKSNNSSISPSQNREEIAPERFTNNTIHQLELLDRNYQLFEQNYKNKFNQQKFKGRIKRQINDIRIIQKDPAIEYYNYKINDLYVNNNNQSASNNYQINNYFESIYNENSILIMYSHYIQKLTLDVDFFRYNEICENDQDYYTCINALDFHFKDMFLIGNSSCQVQLWNLVKNKSASIYKNDAICQSIPTAMIQDKQLFFVGDSEGYVNFFDFRQSKSIQQCQIFQENQVDKENIEQTNQLAIKNLDFMDNQLLISSNRGFSIYDIRNIKELYQVQSSNLQKANFSPNSNNNILFFSEGQQKLQVWNSIKTHNLKEINTNSLIQDLIIHKECNEVALLCQQDSNMPSSSLRGFSTCINILSNDKSILKQRDQLIINNFEPSKIIFDKDFSLLYILGQDKVKVWKYYNKQEIDIIQNNLLKLIE